MSTCLVTTLKESTGDASLRKLDEFFIECYPKSYGDKGRLVLSNYSDTSLATIEGDGYFTDENETANLGKTMQVSGITSMWLSNGRYRVRVSNKQNIAEVSCFANTSVNGMSERIDLDLQELMGTKTSYIHFWAFRFDNELSVFKYIPTIRKIRIGGSRIKGDLNDLSDCDLQLLELRSVEGTIPQITGNLSALTAHSSLTHLNLNNVPSITGNVNALQNNNMTAIGLIGTNTTGALSHFATMSSLGTLMLDGTGVTGDTSSLAGLTNLTTFTYTNTAITGTWPLV